MPSATKAKVENASPPLSSSQSGKSKEKALTIPHGTNSNLQKIHYAVRGPLVTRASELAATLPSSSLPFSHITWCNIGNPQQLGQKPFTFAQQVLACCLYPDLMKAESIPTDVKERVSRILEGGKIAMGAYSGSKGPDSVRKTVAEAIPERDGGWECRSEDIYLMNGASEGISIIIEMIIRNGNDGLLVPSPQYPLYTACTVRGGGRAVDYELSEEEGWGLDVELLKRLVRDERDKGVVVRGLIVTNPGNPTGTMLGLDNMKAIVNFCEEENIVLLADEVYQENIYRGDKKFVSFKKVVRDVDSDVELFSFHSVSKGLFGECGLRGGYMECVNIDGKVMDLIYKLWSVKLCPNLPGQVMVDIMMKPPKEGDESYPIYKEERDAIFGSLKRKAAKLTDAFHSFEGVSCTIPEGAMYLFPKLKLPRGAHEEARKKDLTCADQLYARELLEETGICVVPGSGFGQVDGTTHIRTTILPPEHEIDEMVDTMRGFHNRFLKRYSSGNNR